MPEVPPTIVALGESYVRLWEQFSEFPTREEVAERIRIFKPRSLANLDCKGRGPSGRQFFAGKICYPRDQVVAWFASLAGPPKSRLITQGPTGETATVSAVLPGVSESSPPDQPESFTTVSEDSGRLCPDHV